METGTFHYGPHPLQEARVFRHDAGNNKAILFIHGGAWRDPSNTYNDFAPLIHTLHARHAMHDTTMVSMNYRLSPSVHHPAHLMDVVACIRHMIGQGCRRVSIVGHSVGATLMMQLLNARDMCRSNKGDGDGDGNGDTDVDRDVDRDMDRDVDKDVDRDADSDMDREMGKDVDRDADSDILGTVKFGTFYFVDGIYDMQDLVQEYGESYKSFVEMAFSGNYREASQLSWSSNTDLDIVPEKMVVVYSQQDELLSERQSRRFVDYLRAHNHPVEYLQGLWGQHEEVYRRSELASIIHEGESEKPLAKRIG